MVWTSSITMPSMAGIVGHAPAVDKKLMFFVCFYVFLSRFGIMKFMITETLWSSVIFKTIMVPLYRGRFLGKYPSGSKFIPKISHFGIFGAISPHFNSHNGENWCESGNLHSLSHAKFWKNRLRWYTPLVQIYTRNYWNIRAYIFMPAVRFHC